MKYVRLIFPLLLLVSLTTCQEEATDDMRDTASLTIQLTHLVNGEALKYNTQAYTNAVGENFFIQDFKYYLSNIKLRNAASGAFYLQPASYHLVRPEEGQAFEIQLEGVPVGTYGEIEFAIGVDNGANTSTDKVGALDPSNEMAWDWNTGYKFLLLEGKFGSTEVLMEDALVYHIGGDPNYRVITFNLGQLDLPSLTLTHNLRQTIAIEADLGAIFAEPNPVSLAEHPVVMGDPFSEKVADNYAGHMFQIMAIE